MAKELERRRLARKMTFQTLVSSLVGWSFPAILVYTTCNDGRDSVLNRRSIKFRSRGITQTKNGTFTTRKTLK